MAEVQRPHRVRRFVHQHSFRPLITYGKKNTTPLIPLTGNQFRSSIFDLPLDEEHVEKAHIEKAQLDRSREPCQNSELFDVTAPILQHQSLEQDHQSYILPPDEPRLKSGPANARTSALPAAPLKKAKTKARRKSQAVVKQDQSVQRRLLVTELLLVTSPVDYTVVDVRPSSPLGIDKQDPIADPPSSLSRANFSSTTSESSVTSNHRPRGNLSAIQVRLKPRRSIFKQINRVKQEAGYILIPRGDGFDNSELRIIGVTRARRRPKPKSPSMLAFAELKLTRGPLPDTRFHDPELQLGLANGDGDVAAPTIEHNLGPSGEDGFTAMSAHEPPQAASRASGIRAQQIIAQLSSITAPARPRSDSGISGQDPEEGEDEEVEEDDDAMQDDDRRTGYGGDDQPLDDSPPRPSRRKRNEGALLGFRQVADSNARTPSTSDRLALMEVNEPIVEVLDSRKPRTRRTIMQNVNGDEDILNPILDPILESSGTQYPPQNNLAALARPAPTRSRSILKNSIPIIIDRSTRPESTASNTHQNSIVDTSASRYFSDAVDLLAAPDPSRHTIVPRRRPSYLCDDWIDVLNTDAVVPETSPQQHGYVAESSRSVLRRTGDEVWASTGANVPRDLKSLIRSASREHGTIGQSVRRRPSLPFQSPTKVR